MEYVCFSPDNPKDWVDASTQILKLIFGDKVPPVILRSFGCILAFGLLLIAIWGLLLVASKIKDLWVEQIWPIFYDVKEIQRRELRRRFADHVESEIRRLNNLEQWSDHRFTELEAEVQAEGKSRITTPKQFFRFRRTTSLRRAKSLSEALEHSTERLILLEGDPGAGKSVALRHLTQVLSARALSTRRVQSTIPIYVSLKELNRTPGDTINKELIRSFVLRVLNRTNSRDVSEFLAEEFDEGLRNGTWIFLFDSFDEIPEVLSSVEADRAIESYAEAIADFLGGFNRCRGIVASRQFRGPGRLGWARFEILTLTLSRMRELVKKAALDPDIELSLITSLHTATVEIRTMAANPMFLGLLIEYVRVNKDFPENAHVVFERYMQNRFDRDAAKIQKRFGLNSIEVRLAAESAAFCMAGDPGLGLSPTREALRISTERMGYDVSDAALTALEFMKIARASSDLAVGSEMQFSFSHRRFQEYFATCVVLRDPKLVDPYDLLTDGRWRETAVVLCQTQPPNTLELVITKAQVLIGKMRAELIYRRGASVPKFPWPAKSIHLLGLLQDASSGNRTLVSGLSSDAGRILQTADKFGNTLDKIWATEIAGVAGDQILLRLLRNSFASPSRWLQEIAFRQAARLTEMPSDVSEAIRVALIELAAKGRLFTDSLEIKAQLARLKDPSKFLKVVRLLRWMFFLDSALFALYTLLLAMKHPFRTFADRFYGVLFLLSGLIIVCLTPYIDVEASSFATKMRPKSAWKGWYPIFPRSAMNFLPEVSFRLFILPVLTAMLMSSPYPLQLSILFENHPSTLHISHSLVLVGIYWMLWSPMCLFCVRRGVFIDVEYWPLFPTAPLLYLFGDFKRRLKALLNIIRSSWKYLTINLITIPIVPFILARVMARTQEWYRKHSVWVRSHVAVGVSLLLLAFVGLPLLILCVAHLMDYLHWRRWNRDSAGASVDAAVLVDLLGKYRTERFRVRLLTALRQQSRIDRSRIDRTTLNENHLLLLASRIDSSLRDSEDDGGPEPLKWGADTADSVYKLIAQLGGGELN